MMISKKPKQSNIIKISCFQTGTGFHTTNRRSSMMSKIKSKNTKAELLLRKALWAKNIRFRINVKSILGKPDIFIKKYRLAIFVDGGFWHGYKWEQKKAEIKSNVGFWIPKIENNMQRDRHIQIALEDAGYTVLRFWDHEINKELPKCVNQVCLYLEAAKRITIPSLI
jgi:DNA mismatch endonuclease (patch repair protein)